METKEKITNEILYEKLGEIQLMLCNLLKVNNPNKLQPLSEAVIKQGRISVREAQTLLGGISRPYTLELMRKLEKQSGFKFVVGDIKLQRPSIVIYEQNDVQKENFSKIKKLVDKKKKVSFAEVRDYLQIENDEIGFGFAQKIINDFVNENKKYFIDNGNTLRK